MTRQLLPLLLGLLVFAACSDTSFDPFDNGDRYFTVYGFLDQLETNHSVRVIPVTRRAQRILSPSDDHSEIDARVYTVDMTNDTRTEWTHSLDLLDDGTYGHVFRSRFIVAPGRSYRLEVVRSDGKMAWAETRVPTIPDAALFERGPVVYSADSTQAHQEIVIPKVASPWDIQSIQLVNNQNAGQDPNKPGALQAFFLLPYGRVGTRTDDGGWRITLDLTKDSAAIRDSVAGYRAQGVYDETPESVLSMGVQVRILDVNWDPPKGVFDPEVLAQPHVLTNVENGFGLFGSIGLYRQDWPVGRELAVSLGYEW